MNRFFELDWSTWGLGIFFGPGGVCFIIGPIFCGFERDDS